MAKIVGTTGPFPLPPEFNVKISRALSVRWGDPTSCGGRGGGIISFSYVISSVWEWSTEFVVRVLLVTVDYEAAFQLILTTIVGFFLVHWRVVEMVGTSLSVYSHPETGLGTKLDWTNAHRFPAVTWCCEQMAVVFSYGVCFGVIVHRNMALIMGIWCRI